MVRCESDAWLPSESGLRNVVHCVTGCPGLDSHGSKNLSIYLYLVLTRNKMRSRERCRYGRGEKLGDGWGKGCINNCRVQSKEQIEKARYMRNKQRCKTADADEK